MSSTWSLRSAGVSRRIAACNSVLSDRFEKLFGREGVRHESNNFDALRLLSALFVFISHSLALSGRTAPSFMGGYGIGSVGLFVLFATGGYLVTASWQSDPDLGRYMVRRFLRIWPGYAVAVLASACVGWAIAVDEQGRYAAWHFLSNLWLQRFEDWFFRRPGAHPMLNGSLWTIPTTIFWYATLGLLAAASRGWLRWVMAVVFIGGAAAFWFIVGETGAQWLLRFGTSTSAWHLGMFFCAGALLRAAPALSSPVGAACIVGGAAALLVLDEYTLALWLLVPLATVLIGRASWPLLRAVGRRGDYSYGVYLYAWPVQQLVTQALGPQAPWPVLLLAALAITAVCAWLSWHLVERWVLRLKPSRRAALGPRASSVQGIETAAT